MFRQFYAPILVLSWLMSVFHLSQGGYLIKPVFCTGVSVNMNYNTALPGASSGTTVTTSTSDHGVWFPCQLGAINTSISYYMTLTATNANCEKATFTDFVFTGFFNCTQVAQLPASAKNLTVPLSDPGTTRYLDEVQPFMAPIVVPFSVTAPLKDLVPQPYRSLLFPPVPSQLTVEVPFSPTVPGFGPLYAVNFTFIFDKEKHKRGECGPIQSERVEIIPQLFLIDLFACDTEPVVPPVCKDCY